jgi:hypothetical protein
MITTNRDRFRDRFTGQKPTDEEWEMMVERAHQIIRNFQFAAPEDFEWAMMVDPAYIEKVHG